VGHIRNLTGGTDAERPAAANDHEITEATEGLKLLIVMPGPCAGHLRLAFPRCLKGVDGEKSSAMTGAVHRSKATRSCPLRVIGQQRSRHVRFAPKADKRTLASICPLSAISGLMQRSKLRLDWRSN